MKKIYLIYAAVVLSFASSAKTTSVGVPDVYPHFNPQAITPNGGSGNIRLIAQTYLTYDGAAFQPVDSTSYSYSGGRGGLLTPDDLDDKYANFDESYTYTYDVSSGAYRNKLKRFQSFDNHNNSVLYSYQKWEDIDVPIPFWKDYVRYQYDYNNINLVASTTFQVWYDGGIWADHVVYDNVYDGNNNVVEMNSTAYNILFSYDSDNRITQRTDVKMNFTTNAWTNDQRINFVYDVNGNLDYYVIQKWNGSWTDSVKLSYTYSGLDVIATTESKWVVSSWVNSGIDNFLYDADHNKLSDIRLDWDAAAVAYKNAYRAMYTYNGNNQPVNVTTNTWDALSSAWSFTSDDYQLRFYYESYIPTGIHQAQLADLSLKMYPVPANDVLNLDMKWANAQPCTISVYDLQGRLLKHFDETASTAVHKNIPVNDLPSGNYFVRVTGTNGQKTEKFEVIH